MSDLFGVAAFLSEPMEWENWHYILLIFLVGLRGRV